MDENNNNNIVQEILHDLFSSLEALETQNTAILEFLKDKGIGTDEELAPHLEQAGKASEVRWRAVRVRADYLFSSAIKAAEQAAEKESPKPAQPEQESKTEVRAGSEQKVKQNADQNAEQKTEQDVVQDRNQPGNTNNDSNTPRKNDIEKAA
jgi:hypothetical protein